MTERGQAAFASTALPVVAFGVAMGYLESTVVVYLRAAVGIVPSAVPAHDPKMFEAVETLRELTTLVMIAAVGWLVGRTRLERLAWAAVVFGASAGEVADRRGSGPCDGRARGRRAGDRELRRRHGPGPRG